MPSRNASGLSYFFFLVLLMLVCLASSDLAKDRAECADQLVGLATCLPYVGGDAKAPTIDCCTGLKQVLSRSKKCLCILVKDRDDPNLGLKINATLALGLPASCHSPANVSDCPALLHLAPNSTEAKVFEDYTNSTRGSSTSAPVSSAKGNSSSSGTSAQIQNGSGRGKRWLAVEMVYGLLTIWCLASFLVFGV